MLCIAAPGVGSRPTAGQLPQGIYYGVFAGVTTDLCLPRPTAQDLGVTQQIDPLVWNLEVGDVVRSPTLWLLQPMHTGSRRVGAVLLVQLYDRPAQQTWPLPRNLLAASFARKAKGCFLDKLKGESSYVVPPMRLQLPTAAGLDAAYLSLTVLNDPRMGGLVHCAAGNEASSCTRLCQLQTCRQYAGGASAQGGQQYLLVCDTPCTHLAPSCSRDSHQVLLLLPVAN